MAATLQCEICGGKLVGKPGGVFECDSCGMEYSTEWAKQKIQEIKGTVKVEGTVEVTGKVQVEGGSVTLEGAATKESLLKRAKMCLEDAGEKAQQKAWDSANALWEQAWELLEQVLNADPECGEAYLYRCMAKHGLWKETFVAAYCDVYCIKIADDPDVKKAFRYASGETAAFLDRCAQERERAIQADLKHRMEMRPILAQKCKIAELAAGRIIARGTNVFGLKSDGTVVDVGDNDYGQCDVSDWKLFNSIDTLEDELRQAAEKREDRKRREAEARAERERREAEACAKRRAALDAEAASLKEELANLKGLFSDKRRRKIEARLAAIETERKGL